MFSASDSCERKTGYAFRGWGCELYDDETVICSYVHFQE